MAELSVRFLPARQGDAIWVTWGDGHQLMIDMGTEQVGKQLAARLAALPEEGRRFELLVVTHVDADHIGGVLTCVADTDDPIQGLEFADVWFNGWEHLHNRVVAEPDRRSDLEAMGPAQGERLTSWLRRQRWNEAFGRGPVIRGDDHLPVVELPDGLTLTVIGPNLGRLADLIDTWQEEVEVALAKGSLDEVSPGLEPMGPSTPPILDDEDDLHLLADTPFRSDPSKANGCSISFLLDWEGRRLLFTGDAFADDLNAGLGMVDEGRPVDLDLVKVPHHGSQKNVTDELVRAVRSPYWLFSTDGTRHRHPDAVAIARILRSTWVDEPVLGFNVPSTFNGWWSNPQWIDRFGFTTETGDPGEGLVKRWEPR
jgi:hypothetical protein